MKNKFKFLYVVLALVLVLTLSSTSFVVSADEIEETTEPTEVVDLTEEVKETANKLTYEQLEQAAMQLQQRVIMAEGRLRSIDMVSMRLTWLFKVLENKEVFPSEFINKCSEEVVELLTLEEEIPEAEVEEVN